LNRFVAGLAAWNGLNSAMPTRSLPSDVVTFLQARFPVEMLETISAGELRVGVSGDLPTDYVDDGAYVGIHGEVKSRVAEMLGLTVSTVSLEWPEMLEALAALTIDLPGLGTAWTPDRARRFRFTQPFQFFFYGVASLRADALVDVVSLRDATVSAEAGCFNNDELLGLLGASALTLRATPGEIVADLCEGRAEVAVYDYPVLARLLAAQAEGGRFCLRQFRFDERYPQTTERFACHFVFRADAVNLQMAADLAIDALKQSGELAALYERYGFGGDDLLSMAPRAAPG
jgi:ABC-type amino acid transport substrate-binding protein